MASLDCSHLEKAGMRINVRSFKFLASELFYNFASFSVGKVGVPLFDIAGAPWPLTRSAAKVWIFWGAWFNQNEVFPRVLPFPSLATRWRRNLFSSPGAFLGFDSRLPPATLTSSFYWLFIAVLSTASSLRSFPANEAKLVSCRKTPEDFQALLCLEFCSFCTKVIKGFRGISLPASNLLS